MEIHHDKHHQAYVDNANKALAETEWADSSVEEVLAALHMGEVPEDIRAAVRNNAGGHANHTLFWEIMGPDGGGEPSGALGDAITQTFGSFDGFTEKLTQNGVTRFGSGWSWLVWNGSGSRPTRPRTRTRRSWRVMSRCSGSTCGSTPTTSTTRIGAPTTSRPGGTS